MSVGRLTKEVYFVTMTVVDWVDVFTRPIYKHCVLESLVYCQKHKGLDIYSWVLMSNHLHMLVGLSGEDGSLSDVLRDFKKFTSKKLVELIANNNQESRKDWMLDRFYFAGKNDKKIKNHKFWQDGSYVEDVYSFDFFKQKLEYIHNNPVVLEIVEKPEDYLYSSARNYAGRVGVLDVLIVE